MIDFIMKLKNTPIAKTYENAELASIIPFTEDKRWYLKLIYKYEDKKGKHTVVIPKAAIPFESMELYDSVCGLASERGIKEPSYCFDIITEYAPREMTLDDIEKELGYKIKVINKENNDD